MTPVWFDTHCHLDSEVFDADRAAVMARAQDAGVARILNPAYDLASSRRAIALAQAHANVWAAVGVHPNSAADVLTDTGWLDEIRTLASQPRVVAIGEIGLDYHWDTAPRDAQKRVFIEQLELARTLQLPVIIHCRSGADPERADAWSDLLGILFERAWLDGRVLLHAYAGTLAQALAATARGYRLGLGGPLTYPKSETARQVAEGAPLEALLMETDAPYLAPQKYRGRRNEPGYLPIAGLRVAELRGLPVEQLAQACSVNAGKFFGIPPLTSPANPGL